MNRPIKSALSHPHDLLTRNNLADADMAADLLRNYLDPHWAALIDLDNLKREAPESVDRSLSELLGDLRYSGRFKGSGQRMNVFVFLEHQSRPDRLMSFRLLEYVCAAYRQHLSVSKKSKESTFPYPMTVVLHHGKKPWERVTPMRELIDTVPGVRTDILELPVFLVDLARIPPDDLRGHPVVCALLDSLQSASTGRLGERVQSIFGRLRGLNRDNRLKSWALAFAKYYVSVQGRIQENTGDLFKIFTGFYNKKEAEKMALTIAEEWVLEGMAKGEIKSVIAVLEARFGKVPTTLKKKLEALRDSERIERAVKSAAICDSLKDFQQSL